LLQGADGAVHAQEWPNGPPLSVRLRTDGTRTDNFFSQAGRVGEHTVFWCTLPFDFAAHTCDDVGMSTSTTTLDNPLDSAIRQLNNICSDGELLTSSMDAGSVRRMLTHIANINMAVLASTQDHGNASKRLNDFAFTLDRIARKAEPPNETLTARMTAVAMDLRAASEELARSDTVPNWQVRASLH
jgi:hypothetical protein